VNLVPQEDHRAAARGRPAAVDPHGDHSRRREPGGRRWQSREVTQTQPEVDPQPVGRVRSGVLHERDFAFLFAGQAVSVFGDRLVMVAMPFAVLTIPGAGLGDVGLVLGSSALTLALFVLVGGVWGDRFPRRRTMLISDVVRALAQGITAALLLTGHASVGVLMVSQAVYGAAEAFFRPAAMGLVPQIVSKEQIQPANALLALTSNTAMVVGPAVAGLLVAVAGAGTAVAVDAGTYVVSAVALLFLRPRPVPPADGEGFLSQLRGGWFEVQSRTWVWSIILSFTAYHALVLPTLFILGPAYAESDRGGAAAWGVISAGFGLGAVSGSLLALRWRPSRPGLVVAGALCMGATQCAVVVSPLPTLVVAALEAVTGVGVAVCFTVWETALQERIPAAAQSRVSSFDYLGSLTFMPLGYLLVGPAVDALGNGRTAAVCTLITLAVAAVVAAGRDVRSLRPT
jgi:MFS family permease